MTAFKILPLTILMLMATMAPLPVMAAPSETAMTYAKLLGTTCPDRWESQDCLRAVSQSNQVLAASYGGALQERKLDNDAETIKQHCAASTAATQGEYPAYALKSAFVECANAISDVSEKTAIQPDLSHYQLLIGAVMCLDKDPGCVSVTRALQAHAARK